MVDLPIEIIEQIVAYTRDWELATTLGLKNHGLPFNAVWWQATALDWAILSSSLLKVKDVVESHSTATLLGLSQWGARVMIRFGYVDMLEYLFQHPKTTIQVKTVVGPLLATVASSWGRVQVLEWAKANLFVSATPRAIQDMINEEAIDEASRHGQILVLEWWKSATSLYPLKYSENALTSATFKQQIAVLEWWKTSGLPLKISNVLDFASMGTSSSTASLDWWSKQSGPLEPKYTKAALYSLSCSGNIAGLNWWRDSRFPLLYDKEVLIGATKHGQVAALQWWQDSDLQVDFRFFDIEAAIEDAVANQQEVLAWWQAHGYNEQAGVTDWMGLRRLPLCDV